MINIYKRIAITMVTVGIFLLLPFLTTNFVDAKTQYCCKCATGVSIDSTKDIMGSCTAYKSKSEAELNCKAKNCLEVQECANGCNDPKWTKDSSQDQKNKNLSTSDLLGKAQYDAASHLNPAKFSSPTDIIAIGMKFGLGIIGLVTLALYIWAGFLWGTSKGNAEKTGKAVQIIMWTTIGVFTMLISYRAIKYIFDAVIK